MHSQSAEEWRVKLTRLRSARIIQRAYRYHYSRRWIVRTLDKNFQEQMNAQKKNLQRLLKMGMRHSLAGKVLILLGTPAQ